MKVKLLKKVRKRFSIFYNENGHYVKDWLGTWRADGKYLLIDKNEKSSFCSSNNKEDLLRVILKEVRIDYPHLGKNGRSKKIWY